MLDLLFGTSALAGWTSLVGEAIVDRPRTEAEKMPETLLDASSFPSVVAGFATGFGAGSREKRGIAVAFTGLVWIPD